ncbi:ankyrin repeat family protein [Turkeypox virus]|uniref:Ankyrin repeat family protein n=1 Tax=Turkeypox virus TaxID=336486 RepID=A0A0M3ZEQ4_9POXV|nr:ankyrin repeat family protein [Turkeypox virus]ALA62531.1 ankyrin repeat family protein [Turkeypox virus]
MRGILNRMIIIIESVIDLSASFIYITVYIISRLLKYIDGSSILYISIRFHYNSITKFILDMGINPNIPFVTSNNICLTPLIYAIDYDNVDAFRLLIQYGADINLSTNNLYVTPLYAAVVYKNIDCVNILIDNRVDINVVTSKGITPLEWCIMTCYNELGDMHYIDQVMYLTATSYANIVILETLTCYFILCDACSLIDKTSYGYKKINI